MGEMLVGWGSPCGCRRGSPCGCSPVNFADACGLRHDEAYRLSVPVDSRTSAGTLLAVREVLTTSPGAAIREYRRQQLPKLTMQVLEHGSEIAPVYLLF